MLTKIIKIKFLTLVIAIIFSPSFLVHRINADTIDNLASNDEEFKKELEKNEERKEQARKLEEIIEIKQKQQASLSNQISIMDANIHLYETEIVINRKKIEDLNSQISRKQLEVKDKEENILSQKKLLGSLLKVMYEAHSQSVISLILMSENFSPFLSEKDQISQTSEKISEIVEKLRSLKDKLEEEKVELVSDRTKLAETHVKLEEKSNNLEYTKSSKEVLLSQTQGEEAKYQKLLDKINNEIFEIESRKFVNYANIPAAKGGYFDYPVSSPSKTQSYGCLKDSFARKSYPSCDNGKGGFHNGIDYGKNSGENIYAASSGKVIESGNNNSYAYGQWIAIDHGDGLVTLYGHLSSKSVSRGDKVKKGDKLGKMGSTGYSTGTHLHFTVFDKNSFEIVESKYINGLYIPIGASVNPGRYL